MTTMIKKQDKPIGSVSFQLGTMMRTIDVYVYGWGVSVSVREKTEKGQTIFDHRNFNETKKYPDIESNIRRGMRYYKASDLLIDEVLKQYEQAHTIGVICDSREKPYCLYQDYDCIAEFDFLDEAQEAYEKAVRWNPDSVIDILSADGETSYAGQN